MLIRTQIKDALVNVNNIDTIICRGVGEICAYHNSSRVLLGSYYSREQAYKVLDIIQHRYLQYQAVIDCDNHVTFRKIPQVFEMPQENEV